MVIHIKYDIHQACKIILQEQLKKMNLTFTIKDLGEVEIIENLTEKQQAELNAALSVYGIEIISSQKSALIQKIKDTIIDLVYFQDKLPNSTISVYLAEKLNHSYGYLSNLFSEVTYTSIENFIILQKIERVKKLIVTEELTLTEISYKLNYSSVAHLSNQFKKVTGLTPTAFQRIINKRMNLN